MTEHVHEWELGDIGTTLHVRVGWVCSSPSCSAFLTVTQTKAMLNAAEQLSAKNARWVAEHFQPQVVKESITGLKLDVLRAYAKARGE